jgi:ubiquinone/menaquinone biosynthesis C-methylase UbiE
MTRIDDFISGPPKALENGKLYNFLEASPSAKFYDEYYGGHKQTKPELYDQVKQAHREEGTAYRIMEGIISFLEKELHPEAIVIELGGGMFQKRSANANQRLKNYFPLDIGYSNIRQYTEKYDRPGFVADATNLPFKDNSVDCVLTHTFLEHPLQPEKVVSEIARVLKPGGIVIHNDAWFCRWWQRFGFIGMKRVKNMTIKEKSIWLLSRVTEFPLVRITPIVVKRLAKTVFSPRPKNISLAYSKLQPNYSLHLGCDEDAASNLDPIDVVRFYESRGFQLLKPLSLAQRLFYPNKYIALRKGEAPR